VQLVLEVQSTAVARLDPNLKLVAVVPGANPAPAIVTVVPPAVEPVLGATLSTAGVSLKRSCLEIVLVPIGVVTVTYTVPAVSAGESAVIEVAELTVKLVALLEPKLTDVAPSRLEPVMVTAVPPAAGPLVVESFSTVGGDR
jgi:hypothetical protein